MHRSLASARVAMCALLAACASTKVETTGVVPAAPLCQAPGQSESALVLWVPSWRADQKDVAQREEAARAGIEAYFESSGCFSRTEVLRLPGKGPFKGTSTLPQDMLAALRAAVPSSGR